MMHKRMLSVCLSFNSLGKLGNMHVLFYLKFNQYESFTSAIKNEESEFLIE